jgi:hypothetical protein
MTYFVKLTYNGILSCFANNFDSKESFDVYFNDLKYNYNDHAKVPTSCAVKLFGKDFVYGRRDWPKQ